MDIVKKQIIELLQSAGVSGEIELTTPPKPEMGNLAFACFGVVKEWKMSPVDAAKNLCEKIKRSKDQKIIERVEVFGPYVNFFLNAQELARLVLESPQSAVQSLKSKIMVEFAHPNTHKPVHIGHLRNMITGESVVRILENQGCKVIRANYQGDVGMHIAKCLWAIVSQKSLKSIKSIKSASVQDRAKFLGEVYAIGGQAYESDEKAKKEIEEINEKIYSRKDKEINQLYKTTRKWSLDYFDYIYKRVGVKKFDRLYFESETFKLGKKIVLEGVKQGIFKESQGAVIFEGSKYGLHDRVFVNSKGLPTYEAKDQALARMQFKEYKPDEIWHLVAKEQTEYFKVIFKAMEFTVPESLNREKHLIYGWVSLKEGKMSSRTGQVVLAEWLLGEAEKKISEVMKEREIKNKEEVIRRVANAAIKYSMLKTGIENDIVFDFNESISLTGDSGPYLLYIVARINSILKKSKVIKSIKSKVGELPDIQPEEKKLLLVLAKFEGITEQATTEKDPAKVAKYLFEVAQAFNSFYQVCPVLNAEVQEKNFRLHLIKAVKEVMEKGLYLLGIETVEEM